MKKLDVYSDLVVPFDVAVLCRSHKFSPAAVSLARALKKKNDLIEQQDQIEKDLARAEAEIHKAIGQVQERFGG